MATPPSYEGIKKVARVTTQHSEPCNDCHETVGGSGEAFARSVNHYLHAHGYRLLHVGTESVCDDDDRPFHTTVAVLGK